MRMYLVLRLRCMLKDLESFEINLKSPTAVFFVIVS